VSFFIACFRKVVVLKLLEHSGGCVLNRGPEYPCECRYFGAVLKASQWNLGGTRKTVICSKTLNHLGLKTRRVSKRG
jgi:hypothetical protein